MKKIIDVLQEVMEGGFEQAGYDKKFGFVTVSNRRISASISVMVRWRQQNSTKWRRFKLRKK